MMIYKNKRSMMAALWGKAHPEQRKIYRANYKLKHPEKYKESQRKYHLDKFYGVTLQEYNRQFQIQGGRCAICKIHQSQLSFSLSIDHNHATGQLRGLLCIGCNVKVGLIENKEAAWKENVGLKELAKEYLKGFQDGY